MTVTMWTSPSDATPGYKVKVSVTVRKSGRAGY
jgi:hypothetical protein